MKLTEYRKSDLWHGTVFRFPAAYPFEPSVDLMLMDYPSESGFALYCISGYHAGSLELVLPKEAASPAKCSISAQWMADNWSSWVYAGCTAADVEIVEK
ncbi:hypothetical protein D7V91_09780 [bacterium 1xD42-67]|nr:hypothetical protein D7V91_09780 [bacterium 1xD42-67]